MRKSNESPLSELFIQTYVLEGQNASVAMLVFRDERELLYFTGEAKREPGDISNRQIAQDLALSRAYTQAARFLEHRARVAVRANMSDEDRRKLESEEALAALRKKLAEG